MRKMISSVWQNAVVVCLGLLLNCQTAAAIPADPAPKRIRQADGSYITVVVRGDEHGHACYAEDGTPLLYNHATGMMEPTTLDKAWKKGMKRQLPKREKRGRAAGSALSSYAHPLINDFPTQGHQRTLIFLLEFSDTKFSSMSDPKDFYTRMLNEEGFTHSNGANGSARDFYRQTSMNQFDPEFVVVGPIVLSEKATFYGSDAEGQDCRMGLAVKSACELAVDSLGVDFSEYDANGDGNVDNIAFIYAGNGQADTPNGTEYIWPHAADLDEAWEIDLNLCGKHIKHYFCSNELRYSPEGELIPTGIGTVVHEFGHILGLPDLYNVSYNPLDVGINYWDTMAAGSYNNNMHTPPTFSGYERMVLGWLTPDTLNIQSDSLSLLPPLIYSNKAYYVEVPEKENEFFVLENRQQESWDEFIYGHGMLMWHIDEDDELWQSNTVNVDAFHHHVDIVPADGQLSDSSRSGDTMPGEAGVTHFTLKDWSEEERLTVDGLTEQAGLVSFLVAGSGFEMPAPGEILVREVEDSLLSFTWAEVPMATSYRVVVNTFGESNDTVFDEETTGVEEIRIDGLADDMDYQIAVSAVRGEFMSQPCVIVAHTQKVDFVKRFSQETYATDIQAGGFTAHWLDIEEADDYELTVFNHAYADDTTQKGYDFSGKGDGMPQLWESSSTSYYSVKDYYGAASPSLRFFKDGDYLVVAWPETVVRSLSFWYRAKSASGQLIVEVAEQGTDDWQELASFTPETAGTTITVDVPFDAADYLIPTFCNQVRIRYERDGGFIVVDDIVAECTMMSRTPLAGKTNVSTQGQTSCRVDGLSAGLYSFRVRGVAGEERSLLSPECQVVIENGSVTGITNCEEQGTWSERSDSQSALEQGAKYDLQGRKYDVRGANYGVRGVTVKKNKKYIVK